MPYKIKSIHAHEILDSRGSPTVHVSVLTSGGNIGSASVPSGASTGTHEALELRDGDKKRYRGKGVLKACANVNGPLAKLLVGHDVRAQRELDTSLIRRDGTKNKSRIGANAILGVSMAVAHAAAKATRLPLYSYLRHAFRELRYPNYRLPNTFMNFVNGGLHADTDLDVQEIMAIPLGDIPVRERIRIGAEVFHALGGLLRKEKLDTDLGNEGGYAPRFGSTERALTLFTEAIRLAGYVPGKDVALGLDTAASEIYDVKRKKYVWKTDGLTMTASQLAERYLRWLKAYPIYSIEDPFAEDDWASWVAWTKKMQKFHPAKPVKGQSNVPLVIGDDLYVTDVVRIKKGIRLGATNAVLIKPNQIGSLSETIDAITFAQAHGQKIVVSHRSGETCDTTIADLAVAVNADAIKTGSVARSERVAKYNRLIEIEEEVG
ncbi:MAG: phosphopyruvate hydratase [bacterium]|nr:phosphopyruvate hydratase [bacterium]